MLDVQHVDVWVSAHIYTFTQNSQNAMEFHCFGGSEYFRATLLHSALTAIGLILAQLNMEKNPLENRIDPDMLNLKSADQDPFCLLNIVKPV